MNEPKDEAWNDGSLRESSDRGGRLEWRRVGLILNDSGLTNLDLATGISKHLGDRFPVVGFLIHAAVLDKESYNYASRTVSKGVARRSSDSSRAHHFREEASRLLRAAIGQPTGSAAALQQAARSGTGPVDPLLQQAPVSIFYSHALNVLEDKMPARASVAQIRGILSPENGVKADELQWLGLDAFLQTQELFTKDEVVAFVRANQGAFDEREIKVR